MTGRSGLVVVVLVAGFFGLGRLAFEKVFSSRSESQNEPTSVPTMPEAKTKPSSITGATTGPRASATRALASQPEENQALIKFLKKSDPSAAWFVNRSKAGQVTAISGGIIREDLSDPERALQFAQKIAPLMGSFASHVVASRKELPATAETRALSFTQEIRGHPVFGGEMNIFVRQKDEAIYYIANEFRAFQKVDTGISFGLKEAEQAVSSRYGASRAVKIENSMDRPVIVPHEDDDTKGVLCWQIQVRLTKPRQERRLLFLSTENLKLVRDLSLSVTN